MGYLIKFEEKLMEINKGLPKLPQGLRNFLANWSWLFAGLTTGLGVIAFLASLGSILFLFLAWLSLGSQVFGSQLADTGLVVGGLAGVFVFFSSLVALIILFITTYINYESIRPLRNKLYKGWQLALLARLISLAFEIINHLINGQIKSLIQYLLVSALGLYLLAQIRDSFTTGLGLSSQKKRGGVI